MGSKEVGIEGRGQLIKVIENYSEDLGFYFVGFVLVISL